MIKNTTVNTILTPSGSDELTDTILGRVVEAQTRWSPGSLLASILSASAAAQTVIITAGQVISGVITAPHLVTRLDALDASAGHSYNFTPVGSTTSKSKVLTELTFANFIGTELLTAESGDEVTDPILLGLLLPTLPTYTALAAVNKLESLCIENAFGYVIVVDQESETIHLAYYDTVAHAETAASAMAAHADFDVAVAFLTEPPDVSTSSPSFGWE